MGFTDPGVNGRDSSRSPPISGYFTEKIHEADHSLGYDLREPCSLRGALAREILEKESIAREMEKARMREKMIAYEMARRDLMMQMGYSDPQTVLPSHYHQTMDFISSPSIQLRARAEATAFEGKMAPSQSRGTEGGKPSAENISGTKRKAESPPPPPRAAEAIDVPSVNNNMEKTEEDGLYCKVCKLSSTSKQALTDHLKGRKHKSKEAAALNATRSENLKFSFWCDLCKVGAHNEDVMLCHERGRKHMKRIGRTTEAKGVDANVTHEVENEEVVCKAGAGEDKVVDASCC